MKRKLINILKNKKLLMVLEALYLVLVLCLFIDSVRRMTPATLKISLAEYFVAAFLIGAYIDINKGVSQHLGFMVSYCLTPYCFLFSIEFSFSWLVVFCGLGFFLVVATGLLIAAHFRNRLRGDFLKAYEKEKVEALLKLTKFFEERVLIKKIIKDVKDMLKDGLKWGCMFSIVFFIIGCFMALPHNPEHALTDLICAFFFFGLSDQARLRGKAIFSLAMIKAIFFPAIIIVAITSLGWLLFHLEIRYPSSNPLILIRDYKNTRILLDLIGLAGGWYFFGLFVRHIISSFLRLNKTERKRKKSLKEEKNEKN